MATATVQLRIASFNINGGYRTGGRWSTRLPKVVDAMVASRADIFLLQEAHEDHGEHKQVLALLEKVTKTTKWVLVSGDGGNHFIIDGHKLRVIGKARVYSIPHSRDYVELNLWSRKTGVRFWTWDTHLIASDPQKGRSLEEAAAMRTDQAEYIANRLRRLHRCVGGGDMNDGDMDPGSPREIYSRAGHTDVRTHVEAVTNGELDSHDNYHENRLRGLWVDALLVGDLCEVVDAGLIDSGDASDHNLIYSTVRITGPVTNFTGN